MPLYNPISNSDLIQPGAVNKYYTAEKEAVVTGLQISKINVSDELANVKRELSDGTEDIIDYDNNQFTQKITRLSLDGTISWVVGATYGVNKEISINKSALPGYSHTTSNEFYFNGTKAIYASNETANVAWYYGANQLFFYLPYALTGTTSAAIKAYLNLHPIISYYKIATPVNVPFPTSMTPNTAELLRVSKLVENTAFTTNYLSGKSIATAGDSITEGQNPGGGFFKNYGQLIAERNNMTFYNYGVSGSTLSNVAEHAPFTGRWDDMEDDLDYILLWFGWNDNAYSTVGTIDDAVDTTFYGAWNIVLPGLITKYPLAKIGLIVPYGSSVNIRQAVRDVGVKWGIPYLDTDSVFAPLIYLRSAVVTAVGELRRDTFTYDTTHPNQAGYDYMSTFIEHFVKSL